MTPRTLILLKEAVGDRLRANNACLTLDKARPEDAHTFEAVALNSTGSPLDPIKWWVCCVRLTPANRAKVETLKASFPGVQVLDYDLDTDPEFPFRRMAQAGLKIVDFSIPH
jgi:hypothetical protein